MITILPLV